MSSQIAVRLAAIVWAVSTPVQAKAAAPSAHLSQSAAAEMIASSSHIADVLKELCSSAFGVAGQSICRDIVNLVEPLKGMSGSDIVVCTWVD